MVLGEGVKRSVWEGRRGRCTGQWRAGDAGRACWALELGSGQRVRSGGVLCGQMAHAVTRGVAGTRLSRRPRCLPGPGLAGRVGILCLHPDGVRGGRGRLPVDRGEADNIGWEAGAPSPVWTAPPP